jgi:hypothetical protein
MTDANVMPAAGDASLAEESDAPFDLTAFLSRRLGVSLEDARLLLGHWMREQDRLRRANAPGAASPAR